MNAPEALALPGLPKGADGPVFAEPWQAQAFALVVRLHAEGAFTWPEWAAALAEALAADPNDDGSRYYHHWVAALEALTTRRSLVTAPELAARKQAWEEAYSHTPHGLPVELLGTAYSPVPRGCQPLRADYAARLTTPSTLYGD